MSNEERAEKTVGLAFGKLLKTASEVIEDLVAKDLSAEICCDIAKGVFQVTVCKLVPVEISVKIAELEALIEEFRPKVEPVEEPVEVEEPVVEEEEPVEEGEPIEEPGEEAVSEEVEGPEISEETVVPGEGV